MCDTFAAILQVNVVYLLGSAIFLLLHLFGWSCSLCAIAAGELNCIDSQSVNG